MSTTDATSSDHIPEPEGVRETIESIVVALILAFVFRAFIVEAFVIPTGSMATTLYGAHGTIVCEDCGIEFAYGLKDLDDRRPARPIRSSTKAICPNCGHPNTNLKFSDEKRNAEKGDRILVLKWPFHIGGRLLDPTRWDVIVFKDPSDGVTNFIKRLAGLPNEVFMIADGDAYAVPIDELSPETRGALRSQRHAKFQFRTGQKPGGRMLPALPRGAIAELDKKMTIRRKTPAAQKSLWYTVYDNDHPPQTLDPGQPRWASRLGPTSGWTSLGRRLEFDARNAPDDFIELVGKEIRAACAYNVGGSSRGSLRAPGVSDLRVEFVWTPTGSDAVMAARLEKHGRVFWAVVSMDGAVRLVESHDAPSDTSPAMASSHIDPPLAPGRPVEVAFENVDYRLAVSIDGREVVASSDNPSSPAYFAPDLAALRGARRTVGQTVQPPRIYGQRGGFALTHLVVKRDEYYYERPGRALVSLPWAPRSGWGGFDSPILLRDDEFFMLGDNTAASKDSRLWDQVGEHLAARGESFQLGTVPRDQLIGKAFFVYWPAGHRLEWIPVPGLARLGIIPDVGRMRWIR